MWMWGQKNSSNCQEKCQGSGDRLVTIWFKLNIIDLELITSNRSKIFLKCCSDKMNELYDEIVNKRKYVSKF